MPIAISSLSGETKIIFDTTRLEKLIKKNPEMLDMAVRAIAFQIEGRAKKLAPVDTGALRNSMHTVTHNTSTFGEAVARMQKNKKQRDIVVTEIPKPDKERVAHVGAGVEYAICVEFGTSRMAAQPFLFPATEAVEAYTKHYVEKAIEKSL